MLEGQLDVEECGNGLYRDAVLSAVKEVSLAALVLWIPFKNVELRVVGSACLVCRCWSRETGKSGVLELLECTGAARGAGGGLTTAAEGHAVVGRWRRICGGRDG